MNPPEAAARFAAFVWYSEVTAPATPEEARLFAQENWKVFLPVAQNGLGRLLLRIAQMRSGKKRRTRKRCAAAAR